MEGYLKKDQYALEVTVPTEEPPLQSIKIPSAKKHYRKLEEISKFTALLSSYENSISDISLSGNTYSETVIKKLFPLISSCQALVKLDLHKIFAQWDDSIHLESFSTVCFTLERLKFLVKLDLSSNSLPSHTMDFLGEALSFTRNLKILNLDFNHIGRFGGAILADSLIDLKLNVLSVRNNNLMDEGIIHISSLLETMKTLTKVNVACNNFSKRGLRSLCNALGANESLKLIDISENFFNEVNCGLYIGDMIYQDKKLKSINLSDCFLGNTECKKLMKFLRSDGIEINLKHNQLEGKSITKKLFDLVKQKRVKAIYISGNDLEYDDKLPRVMEDNRDELKDRKYLETLSSLKDKPQYFYFL